jgi:cation transport ATPase
LLALLPGSVAAWHDHAYLEALGGLRALAMDKTGTVTEGKPRVLGVLTFESANAEDIRRIAAAIDSHSTHPLAQAVVRRAEESKVTFASAENYQAKTGRGAEATIAGPNISLAITDWFTNSASAPKNWKPSLRKSRPTRNQSLSSAIARMRIATEKS